MVFMPNKSTPDYLFEKANQCFRRSRTDSNARVELEARGNEFMVKAIDLDIKLQNLAKFVREEVIVPQARFCRGSVRPDTCRLGPLGVKAHRVSTNPSVHERH
jgi:hypothetical protein